MSTAELPSASPAGATARSHLSPRMGGFLAVAVAAPLLLWNLGAYALWDDEANTGIFAANVWKTGDTNAFDGTNIIAFRGGLELAGIKNRAYPPLQYFYAAPFLGLLGRNALAARLPFALAGLVGFFLWGWWLLRDAPNWLFTALMAVFTLGNVSLVLYLRQSRYYALAFTLALAFVYLYLHRARSRRHRILLAVTGVALLACHYLTYGATMVCLAVDYLLFERRRQRDSWRQIAFFLATQAAGLCAVVGVFFPFGRKVTPYVPASWWHDKLVLFWWNLRDLNATECLWLPLLALAAVVALARRDAWLGRAVVALVRLRPRRLGALAAAGGMGRVLGHPLHVHHPPPDHLPLGANAVARIPARPAVAHSRRRGTRRCRPSLVHQRRQRPDPSPHRRPRIRRPGALHPAHLAGRARLSASAPPTPRPRPG